MSTPEDVQRLLKELQARTAAAEVRAAGAEARAERERREKEEAEARAGRERREKEEAEARAAGAEARAERERREKEEAEARAAGAEARAERERREKEEAEARAEVSEQRQAPTPFLDYIRHVEQHVFLTLSIEPDPKKKSSASATSVRGKFYPQHFQPWTDFVAVHNATFSAFSTAFANNAYFPALASIETLGHDLSPKVADELGLRPFIRASIEKPAATIVSKYLEIARHEKFKAVGFTGNAYGITAGAIVPHEAAQDLPEPARKRRSPVKDIGIPDRWLVAHYHDGNLEHALVGDIKPVHVFPGVKVNRVLSAPPGDDFFLRATRQDGASTSGQVPGEVYVAKAIGQVFHYMVTSGLEFGYVAAGDSLIFLRVREDDPNTLYYFWSVFPVDRSAGVAATREPRETALAHLATLCMLSIRSTRRSTRWIVARNKDLRRWPQPKTAVPSLAETSLPLLPHDGGGGGGGGGAGGAGGSGGNTGGSAGGGESRPGTQSTLKRPHSHGSTSSTGGTTGAHEAQQARFVGPFVEEPPTLPYCTQACLRSLCCGRAPDRKCPNAKLHQAAAHSKDGHALTANEVRKRVVAQLAENMDKDCKSFLFDGDFGRYGVLFKITVTGFGYTFVAKAVLAQHRHVLQHEVAIYTALGRFQGWLIPVCLGLIDLEQPIPLRNCQYVSHMMLMSYAGPDICTQKAPPGVDVSLEIEKTRKELSAAGLSNDDIHEANLAWNDEMLRVMEFDFDDAYVRQPEAPATSPERSPLRVKRNWNAYYEGNKRGGQVKKRARAATYVYGERDGRQ